LFSGKLSEFILAAALRYAALCSLYDLETSCVSGS